MNNNPEKDEIHVLGSTLLEIGALLMVSGASSGRIRNTINRISDSFGYSADMLISQRTLMLNIYNEDSGHFFNSLKRTSPHGVNFVMLSGISRMSWLIVEQKWNVKQINEELKRLRSLPHYPRMIILSVVGLAGAAFCRLAGGVAFDMVMVFIGTFCGLFVRQEAMKMKFNPYMCVYFAAFVSSLLAGIPAKLGSYDTHEHAFATSVLFLIPGVPLINSFSDMIDGNLQNGLIRGLNGFIISFTIALGLLTSMFIYQF
ncbi:MAG: threonine/serine exporter family protein [Sphingobacteriaceae bacterium]|nr:threonine/serine exporter family protein [Sphingobacteriaceae bacterium]